MNVVKICWRVIHVDIHLSTSIAGTWRFRFDKCEKPKQNHRQSEEIGEKQNQ